MGESAFLRGESVGERIPPFTSFFGQRSRTAVVLNRILHSGRPALSVRMAQKKDQVFSRLLTHHRIFYDRKRSVYVPIETNDKLVNDTGISKESEKRWTPIVDQTPSRSQPGGCPIRLQDS